PVVAAVLLVLGALGTWAAVASGESDGGLMENTSPVVNSLVDAHETWAKRTLAISIFAAFAAGGAAMTARWPRIARAVAIVAALLSTAAAYGIYETGHRGGALVYRHGAGIEMAVTQATVPNVPKPAPTERDAD
ncbi:MAG: hypothetical protein ACREIC_25155, partial [Limisphaerales bacterium]